MTPIAANNINSSGSIPEEVSMSMLKKTLDSQKGAIDQLMKSLLTVQDKSLGQKIDIYA
jgi:hypothetical protein